ncbi:MAG: hypothetical protein HC927_12560 [Deltaproteobacteria bacterium]|nr:hypothetical protein [Deltaproteobacteria bacterium]
MLLSSTAALDSPELTGIFVLGGLESEVGAKLLHPLEFSLATARRIATAAGGNPWVLERMLEYIEQLDIDPRLLDTDAALLDRGPRRRARSYGPCRPRGR